MFCCKNGATFSPPHELDGVLKREKRRASQRSVISKQPGAHGQEVPATTTEGKDQSDEKGRTSINSIISEHLNVDESNKGGRRGVRAPQIDITTTEIKSYPKPHLVAEALKCAILNNQFLKDVIPEHIMDKVINAMEPRDVLKGDVIIKQGEPGDEYFINETGSFEVLIKKEPCASFNTPRVFGELAWLYKQPRAATIRAMSDGKIWSMKGPVSKALLIEDAKAQEEQRLSFLRKVRPLKNCPDDKLREISILLKQDFYSTNTRIVEEGQAGDKFYIIKAGKVTVTKAGAVVANLGENDYFGEKALTESDVRQATCIADAPGVTCFELTRKDFIDYLGDFQDFVSNKPIQDEGPRVTPQAGQSCNVQSLDQLKKLVCIGEGGFGRVHLVKDTLVSTKDSKDSNDIVTYALKMIAKVDNNSKEQREHVLNEKNIHLACKSSRFIVKLYKTFTDKKYLYFLMEVCMGGDLYTRMQRVEGKCFNEENARFVSGCILEALAYMHSKNFVYRDLKPENMLIDNRGYIKLADFGFAKELSSTEKTYTFAGTPEYVAPEVILSKGHNYAVDYWAFGIFVFELLVGKTPFKSSDPSYMVTYSLILKGIDNIMFPKKIGKAATKLIKKLCKTVPHERLGCQRGGVNAIRSHEWYQSFKWNELQEGLMKWEYAPKLSDAFDTQYFDQFDEEHPEAKDDDSVIWKDFDKEI